MKTVPYFRSALTVILFTILAVGCAKKSGNDAAYDAAYDAESDNCSAEFVMDYNRVVIRLQAAYTVQDFEDTSSLVKDFQSKYKDVVCTAAFTPDTQLDPTEKQVDVNETTAGWKAFIDEVLAKSKFTPSSSNTRLSFTEIRMAFPTSDAN